MAEAREVVLAVGIDDGGDLGQPLVGLVVVDDDHVGAERGGGSERGDAGGAAVDGDDEAGALAGERGDRLRAGAVAFGHAVGNVDACLAAVRGEEALHQGSG